MFIFTLISVALSVYVFPPHSWSWLAFVFLVPLLFDLETMEHPMEGFLKMWAFGAIMMAHFHSWILDISPWASSAGAVSMWLGLSAYLGLFYGAVGLTFVTLRRTNFSLFLLPVIWTFFEWLRELAPFSSPGGTLGYSQVDTIWMALAPYTGVLGISFVCVLVNVLLFTLISESRSRSAFRVWPYAVPLFLLTFVFHQSVQRPILPQMGPISVAIVQGNHSQETKLNPRHWAGIVDDYLRLSDPYWDHNVVLWPENLIPRALRNDPYFTARIQSKISSPNHYLIFGATEQKAGLHYNGITIIGHEGQTPISYQKERLMPFGEYIPFRSFFSLFGPKEILSSFVGFAHGRNPELLQIGAMPLGSAVCLESCYVNPFREQTLAGAGFLTVVVNTAWFNQDKASQQHLHFSMLRAAENQRYLLQSSNIGHSVILSPKGRIDAAVPFRTQGVLSAQIYPLQHLTLYTQKPWLVPGILFVFLFYFSYRTIRYGTGKNAELLF